MEQEATTEELIQKYNDTDLDFETYKGYLFFFKQMTNDGLFIVECYFGGDLPKLFQLEIKPIMSISEIIDLSCDVHFKFIKRHMYLDVLFKRLDENKCAPVK